MRTSKKSNKSFLSPLLLTAVAPSLPSGIPREIVEGQITRLSGISKASVEKVKEFERMIRRKTRRLSKKINKKPLRLKKRRINYGQ